MKKGFFITFEGPEGAGKTTHSLLLCNYLRKKGYKVVHTHEPGGTLFTEYIREILLNPKLNIFPLTELLLYSASRAQHTIEIIKPALKKGNIVVCDRYSDATIAYQGYGRKLNLKLIYFLNKIASDGLEPDLTILLDIPPEIGLKRNKNVNKKDRFEQETLLFHKRVRKGYLELQKQFPERIKLISSIGTVKEIQNKIKLEIDKFLNKK
jgi:dTMP kinase